MTKTITILISAVGSLAALYFLLGSVILSVIIGAVLLCTLLFSSFALGSWWSNKLIQSGADIALKSQISDDNRDMRQVQAIGNLAKEMLRFGKSQDNYLQLPDNTAIEADFEIKGLDQ